MYTIYLIKLSLYKKENALLREQIEQNKIKATNREVNKPSSKKAEWEKDSFKKKDKVKKKRKSRKQKPRKGAGNGPKDKKQNQTATASVQQCDLCGKDLSDQAPLIVQMSASLKIFLTRPKKRALRW